ncbi:MAG: GNAT family N-acetyltransferase [Terriglobia bacterium]
MEVRALGEEDAESWCLLRREGLAGEPLAFGQSVAEHDAKPAEFYAARFRETPPPGVTLGALEGGFLIGIATLVRDTQERRRHKGHIYGFYVSELHRGRRVGTALMQELLRRAAEDPTIEQLLLAVTVEQAAAQALYRKFGFEIWGTEPQSLKVGSTYVDQHYMILRAPFVEDPGRGM